MHPVQLNDEAEPGMHPNRHTEIEMFLRLNRNGRKHILRNDRDGHKYDHAARRDEWLETFVKVSNDLDALHYYLRRDPGLIQDLIMAPKESAMEMPNKKRQKRRLADVAQSAHHTNQELVEMVRQLEEENRALKKENADLRTKVPRLE